MSGSYDTALVCTNGHVVNPSMNSFPADNGKYCGICGAQTISACPHCKAPIRGNYHSAGIVSGEYDGPTSFCYHCGDPYPWTSSALDAAKELTDEIDNLSPKERELLKQSLGDLIADTPRTALAATRFKRLAARAGLACAEGLKSLLISVVTDAAKKQIWG